MTLISTRSRAALDALCRRIVPAAFEVDPPVPIIERVEARIASLEPPLRRDVIGALHFFDHPITGMLLSGRPRRFSTLPAAEQDALLHEWERSPLELRRTVFQALRRLILTSYYTAREAHADIGFMQPLQERPIAHTWEGPLPGTNGDGPVLHAGTRGRDAALRHALEQSLTRSAAAGHLVASTVRGGSITRGATVPGDTALRADACVIGSGAGGAVAAARLAERGFDVVVLEEGGYYTAADFDDDEARLSTLLYADGCARATDDLAYMLLQGRSIGGGTTVNWLMTLRPQPWVFDEWEHEHRLDLLSERVLAPALDDIEEAIHARVVPDAAHSPGNRVIVDGCNTLGWRTLDARINASGCVRSGSCGLGCRWDAKRSAGAVFIPRALAAGARVLCDVRAERVELVERGGIAPLKRVHATVNSADGAVRAHVTVESPLVVLAGGAVGTPALLEKSGLGGGGVGRWLRLHPTTGVFGQYPRPMYAAAGIPQSAVCSEFLQGDDGYGFWIECPPLRPGLAAAALQGFGAEHRGRMQAFAGNGPLIVLVRDGAERRRSSGGVRVDRTGRVHVRYRLMPTDRRHLIRGIQAAARLQLASGADHALTLHVDAKPVRTERDVAALAHLSYGPNRLSLFSAHVNGTCRLGHDARESGCTPDGERHGVPGLYVVDGSLLPTAPGVNPQATIMALASVVVDRIADRHATG